MEAAAGAKGPSFENIRPTLTRLVGGAALAGPDVYFAGQDSRSRGDFFVQSCLPTRVGLGLDRTYILISGAPSIPASGHNDFSDLPASVL
jgi:hypothetical protein